MPPFIEPMTAQSVAALPDGAEWTYELKFDGYRAIIRKDGDAIAIRSRNDKDLSTVDRSVTAAATKLKANQVILDGEIVALDGSGRPSFQALQNRGSTTDTRIEFYAFDVLFLNGVDLRAEPLWKRRSKLQKIVDDSGLLVSSDLDGSAADVQQAVRNMGLEGIIAKRRRSPYRSGDRSEDWRKLRFNKEQEFVIGGFRAMNSDRIESLLVGVYSDRKLQYVAKVHGGLTRWNRRTLRQALSPLVRTRCPFANLPNPVRSKWGGGVLAEEMAEMTWVQPTLIAQIKFLEWTADARLRHPSFLGLRDDKSPLDVVRET